MRDKMIPECVYQLFFSFVKSLSLINADFPATISSTRYVSLHLLPLKIHSSDVPAESATIGFLLLLDQMKADKDSGKEVDDPSVAILKRLRDLGTQVENYAETACQPLVPYTHGIGRALVVLPFLVDAWRNITWGGRYLRHLER